jgi:hypothetical protein
MSFDWIIKHVVEWQKVVFSGGHSLYAEFVVMVVAGNPLNRR